VPSRHGDLNIHEEDVMTIQLDRQRLDRQPAQTRRMPRWLAAVAAVVLVAGAVALIASRRGDSTPADVPAPTIDVQFETQWPPMFGLESKECIATGVEYESANNQRCLRKFAGEAQLSGDITGTALWAMIGNNGVAADANDSAVAIPAAFNGTYLVHGDVAGCGSGEFMIAEQLEFVGWASGQFVGTWQVLPGSGRGDLAKIAGSGTVLAAATDDPNVSRTHMGAVSCV
jgi:hypothetical protein